MLALPRLHPISKTAIECRRAIQRLEQFAELNPEDTYVQDGVVSIIVESLKEVRKHVPNKLKDVDLEN